MLVEGEDNDCVLGDFGAESKSASRRCRSTDGDATTTTNINTTTTIATASLTPPAPRTAGGTNLSTTKTTNTLIKTRVYFHSDFFRSSRVPSPSHTLLIACQPSRSSSSTGKKQAIKRPVVQSTRLTANNKAANTTFNAPDEASGFGGREGRGSVGSR